MKIKSDYVTNSSSTSYVVFIPDGFSPTEEQFTEAYKEAQQWYDYDLDEEMILEKEVYECLELLKEGDSIYSFCGDGIPQFLYYLILELCTKQDFVIASMEVSCEGHNVIYGVKEEAIEKIMVNNIDLLSMFNSLQRSQKDVTEKISGD